MDCGFINRRYQLQSPLLYIRKLPETKPTSGEYSVLDFQDLSFVVSTDNAIKLQLDHSDFPSISERCQKILDSVGSIQEEMSVRRFS